MRPVMDCKDARELLGGFVDRELSGREALEVAAHLEGCGDCRSQREVHEALRGAIGAKADYFRASPGLEARVRAVAALTSPPPKAAAPARPPRNWWGFGAAAVTVAAVLWSVGLFIALPSADDRFADEVVSGHVRSLLPNRAVDVASSDQHTVKPWFSGKIDFSPPVRDLTTEGFPLVGGRVDYLGHRTVAALVYRHRQHLINVFVLPASNGASDTPAKVFSRQGYHALRWTRDGMVFWAASDVELSELEKLRGALLSN